MMRRVWTLAQREWSIRIQRPSYWILAFIAPLIIAVLSVVPYSLLEKKASTAVMVLNIPNDMFDRFPIHVHQYEVKLVSEDEQTAMNDFELGEAQLFAHYQATPKPSWKVYTKINLSPSDSLSLVRTLAQATEQATVHQVQINRLPEMVSSNQAVTSLPMQVIASVSTVLVYLFLFTYCVSLLKGVMEEKSNKVMELLLTSVSPMEWLLGKIMGIGLASLMHFLIWMFMSGLLMLYFKSHYAPVIEQLDANSIHHTLQQSNLNVQDALAWHEWISAFQSISWSVYLALIVFTLAFGFVLYASIFAFIGIVSERDNDTQPFVFIVTAPLLVSFLFVQYILEEPWGSLAQVLSYIPFSAPIAIPVRWVMGVSLWELAVPLLLLAISSLAMVYIAGKAYQRMLNQGGVLFFWTKKRSAS